MGPTACGKTALSLSLAKHLNAEIISVDSALVYKGLDIGTAKPSLQEQATVPHHLIDVREAWQTYSAAEFCDDANRLINDIHARGKRALLVGGTMLYFKALEQGIADLPAADEAVRAELVLKAERLGWQALHDQLRAVDPQSAQRIHPNDPQRLQRALEVYQLTGQPLSELQNRTRSALQSAPIKFALVPTDRAWLHERIERRFREMVNHGFIDEVQALRQQPLMSPELPAMRSVGYRQAWQYLDELNDNPSTSPDDWVLKAVAATRQLAKRQLTWLRSMQGVTRLDCNTLSQTQQLAALSETLRRHESSLHD